MSRQEYEAAAAKAAEKKKATYEKPEWGGGMKQVVAFPAEIKQGMRSEYTPAAAESAGLATSCE